MEQNSTLIVCENESCKAHFTYEHIVIQEESIPTTKYIGLRRRYFVCPVCHKQYTVDITNATLRTKIARFRTMYKTHEMKLKTGKMTQSQVKSAMGKLDRLRREIIKNAESLKKEWS